jgi:phosphohistidine swiveling domain-containing protein
MSAAFVIAEAALCFSKFLRIKKITQQGMNSKAALIGLFFGIPVLNRMSESSNSETRVLLKDSLDQEIDARLYCNGMIFSQTLP